MKELAILRDVKFEAIGKVSIAFTDPITDKIKDQIDGINHIFADVLFGPNWEPMLNSSPLNITDSTASVP